MFNPRRAEYTKQTKQIIMTQKLNFVHKRVENIVGKGESYGSWHFLLCP